MEGLTPEMIAVPVILGVTIVLFVTEVVGIDVAAILVLATVGLSGLVPGGDVFAGSASNAVIAVIAVMILGGTLTLVASGPLLLLNDLLTPFADNLDIDITPTACSPRPRRVSRCSSRASGCSPSPAASSSPG